MPASLLVVGCTHLELQGPILAAGKKEAQGIVLGGGSSSSDSGGRSPGAPSSAPGAAAAAAGGSSSGVSAEDKGDLMSDVEILKEAAQ